MKTEFTVVGVGLRKKGISKKTNNPYDFLPVSITFPRSVQGWAGDCAVTLNCDPEIFADFGNPLPGERYVGYLDIDYRGFTRLIDVCEKR